MSGFIFGVDLDGVCADYTVGFREFVAAERGVDLETLPLERGWDFKEWDLTEEQFGQMHHKAVTEARMLRHLPVIEGAADALWRLSDAGVWIRIITHRLYVNWSHEAAVVDTVAWLDEAQIPYRDICFLGAKPQVEAHVYIDDAEHNVSALRKAGNDVIVFDQPYNRGLKGPRAENWNQVEEIVLELASRHNWLQPQLPGMDSGADRLTRNKNLT